MKFPYFHKTFEVFAWLATIAVFLLNIRIGNIKNFIVKPFDLLIVIIGALIIFAPETLGVIKKISEELKPYLKYILAIILFVALGQFLTWFRHGGAIINVDLIINYARIVFNGFVFFLTALLVFKNESLVKYFSWAVFVGPLAVLPLFLNFGKNIYFSGGRLSGLLQDPNIFGGWMVIAFIIGIALFLENKKIWKRFLIASWLCLIANFILWSASRAGWLALIVGLAIFGLILLFKKPRYEIVWVIIILILTFSIGFLTLPKQIKPFIADRMIGNKIIKSLNLNKIIQKSGTNYDFIYENGFLSYQIRSDIWKNTFLIASKNPFGYGFNYLNEHRFTINNETISFTANIFIEILILGGFGALLVFLIILKKLTQNMTLILKKADNLKAAWVATFFISITDLFFIDGFLFRYFWFILGVILGIYLIERFKLKDAHIER